MKKEGDRKKGGGGGGRGADESHETNLLCLLVVLHVESENSPVEGSLIGRARDVAHVLLHAVPLA